MRDISEFYREQIRRHGDDPRAAGWISRSSQERRFAVIAEVVGDRRSVLDVGCGLGHLYDYLRGTGWSAEYLGIDILPEMVEMASAGGRPARVADLAQIVAESAKAGRRFEVVVSSGVVSTQLGTEVAQQEWLADHLRDAAAMASDAVVVNFLSDRWGGGKSENRWFPRPGDVVDEALTVTPRVTVRHDYLGEYDCTVILDLRKHPEVGPPYG